MQAFYKKEKKIRKKRVSLYFWHLHFIFIYVIILDPSKANEKMINFIIFRFYDIYHYNQINFIALITFYLHFMKK